jgi:hypothetical protein
MRDRCLLSVDAQWCFALSKVERPLRFIEHGFSPVVLRQKSMMRPNSVDARQAPVLGLRTESNHHIAPFQEQRAFERGED